MVEQPGSSLMEFYCRFRFMCRQLKVIQLHQSGSLTMCRQMFGSKSEHSIHSSAVIHWPKVYKVSWWMCHYNSGSPKRTKAFSNSKKIGLLNKGKLLKQDRERCTVKTTVRTKSGGYQGSKELKSTQSLICNGCVYIYSQDWFWDPLSWFNGIFVGGLS